MIHNCSADLDTNERTEIARQLETELAIVLGIAQSLRLALQWMTRDRGNGHKLSTLRFAARSFERHLTRTRVLADHGGYMLSIADASPHLAGEASAMRDRREALQTDFERIILRLEYVSSNDSAAFADMCADLAGYLDQLKEHGQKEMELVQRSFVREEGGEK